MKISGSEVRQGYVIEYKGKLYRVAKAQPVQLGNWRSYLQVELRELHGGTKLNERFRPDETFEKAMLEEKDFQFLYKEGEQFTFMENETYEQISLNQEEIGDGAVYLKDGMIVTILFHDGKALSVALPGYRDHGDRRGRPGGEGADRVIILQAGEAGERRAHPGAAPYRRRHPRGGEHRRF